MHKTTLQRSLGKIIIEENMPKPIKVTPAYGTFSAKGREAVSPNTAIFDACLFNPKIYL